MQFTLLFKIVDFFERCIVARSVMHMNVSMLYIYLHLDSYCQVWVCYINALNYQVFTLEACVHLYIFYLQFKFFVDGQWRHDECQPYMSSEYGIVNTLYFATAEPNFNFGSGVPGPNIPGPSMDVDNQAFQNSVRFGISSLDNTMDSTLLR